MLNNSLAYQVRVRNAAMQLSGLNDCNCAPVPVPPRSGRGIPTDANGKMRINRLVAYKKTGQIGAYQVGYAVRHALSGIGDPVLQKVPALLPVSDRKAVVNAVKAFAAARVAGRLSGMGSAQGESTVKYTASGASVGTSIFPGIGTVIGAVVGAVVGWLLGSKKPPDPRATPEQMNQCRTLLNDYMSFAAQSPNEALPMDDANLTQVLWCLNAIYGQGDINNVNPNYFGGAHVVLLDMARNVVKAIYETPVGGTINLAASSVKIGKQTFTAQGIAFTNPVFTNLKDFNERFFVSMAVQMCQQTAGKGAGGCATFFNRPEFKRYLYDLLGYAARSTLPNISESDLAAASQVAATIPSTSAKDVVSAVESILNRSVIKNETAALLSTASVTPPPSTAPPNTPVTLNVPQAAAIIPAGSSTSAPVINLPPSTPSTPSTTPVAPAVDPFANLPGVSAGAGSGSSYVPTATPSAGPALTTAGIGSSQALWIAGGLGVVAVLFATARPMPAARRTRK